MSSSGSVDGKKRTQTPPTQRGELTRTESRDRRNRPMIGWREWVLLPELAAKPIKAKVDTGAVTSAVQAIDLQLTTVGEMTIARFGLAPEKGSPGEIEVVEMPVSGFKNVRSSNGQSEYRPVVVTEALIGGESFEIQMTLASRDSMGFRMLLGRKAVRNRFWIDPGRAFLQPYERAWANDRRNPDDRIKGADQT